MTQLQFGTSQTVVRGLTGAEDFFFSLQSYISTVGAGTPTTQRDMNIISGGTQTTTYQALLSDSYLVPGTVVTNLTNFASFGGNGTSNPSSVPATYNSSGTEQIQASNPRIGTRLFTTPVSRGAASSNTFSSYITSSLAVSLSAMIDGAIATSGTASAAKMLACHSDTNARNSALWCGNIVDVTALSRDYDGTDLFCFMPLISNHHFLTASHISPAVGATVVWCDNSGNAYAGTVRAKAQLTGTDIAVCYVNDATAGEMAAYNALYPTSAPVSKALSAASIGVSATSAIKPMAFLPPPTWSTSTCALPLITGLANQSLVPVFTCTRNSPTFMPGIGVQEIALAPKAYFYTDGNTYPNEMYTALPGQAPRAAWGLQGASGTVVFTATPAGTPCATSAASNGNVLGAGYPILLGCHHGAPPAFVSPFVSLYSGTGTTSTITGLMQATATTAGDGAASTYSAVTVSITGFTTY